MGKISKINGLFLQYGGITIKYCSRSNKRTVSLTFENILKVTKYCAN